MAALRSNSSTRPKCWPAFRPGSKGLSCGRGGEQIHQKKVDTVDMKADLGTKPHTADRIKYLLNMLNVMQVESPMKITEERPKLVASEMAKNLGMAVGGVMAQPGSPKALILTGLMALLTSGEATSKGLVKAKFKPKVISSPGNSLIQNAHFFKIRARCGTSA